MPYGFFVVEKIDYLCSFLCLVIRHQYTLLKILIYLQFSIYPSEVPIGVLRNTDCGVLLKYACKISWEFYKQMFREAML